MAAADAVTDAAALCSARGDASLECVMPISDLADICTPRRQMEKERFHFSGGEKERGRRSQREIDMGKRSASGLTVTEIKAKKGQRTIVQEIISFPTVSFGLTLYVLDKPEILALASHYSKREREPEARRPPPHLMTN